MISWTGRCKASEQHDQGHTYGFKGQRDEFYMCLKWSSQFYRLLLSLGKKFKCLFQISILNKRLYTTIFVYIYHIFCTKPQALIYQNIILRVILENDMVYSVQRVGYGLEHPETFFRFKERASDVSLFQSFQKRPRAHR
jgi:hypothetical protein